MNKTEQRAPLSRHAMSLIPTGLFHSTGAVVALFAVSTTVLAAIIANSMHNALDPEFTPFIAIAFFGSIIGIPTIVGFLTHRSIKQHRAPIYAANEIDLSSANAFEAGLPTLLSSVSEPTPMIDTDSPDMRAYSDLRVGEITRHFDSKTVGAIGGWLDHSLSMGMRMSAIGMRIGRVGIGVGSAGAHITGISSVHLNLSSTTQTDLFSDSWIAVFEYTAKEGWLDTIRVVVPNEQAMRSFVAQYVAAIGGSITSGTYLEQAIRNSASSISSAFTTRVSYVSDRLNAILRMPYTDRPLVTIAGVQINDNLLLGGAIQIAGDRQRYRLFPLDLVQQMSALVGATGQDPFTRYELEANSRRGADDSSVSDNALSRFWTAILGKPEP